MYLEKTLNAVETNSFIVEIFGLGYVGFPLAVKLSSSGFNVIGIDVNSKRIERLKDNVLMDSELSLKEQFLQSRKEKKLLLSESPLESKFSKIGIICVPTPIPQDDVKSDIFVRKAVENFLEFAKKGDVIILESSIEVGTTDIIQKIIESKNFTVKEDFGLCFCPERIDPSNKEWGIENIPRVIFCSDDSSFKIAKKIYENVNKGNLIRVKDSMSAEVVKSFENAFRLVNISLVNELAILCDKLGISVKEVIDAASTKPFGFLPHYPGAGAGGHCIPKDPIFLLESAKKKGVNFETIHNALLVNSSMPKYICDSIEETTSRMNLKKTILVCGLSYKANVEDMRDSASFKIMDELNKRNFKVYGYDPFFNNALTEKYLIENHLNEKTFITLDNLNDDKIREIECMCVVQHHEQTEKRLNQIYEGGQIPFIYDCQNKFQKIKASKTTLLSLGT
jgi:nucleotide sugar dehydrogenase